MRIMATKRDLTRLLVRLVLCLMFLPVSLQQIVTLRQISPSGCVCPGDTLTYECTIMGREGSTVWMSIENELELEHSQFPSVSSNVTARQLHLAARGISVEGSNYTSQFNVTVTSVTMGAFFLCAYQQNGRVLDARLETIPTIGPLPPPNELCISSTSLQREINYVWSPAVPNCPTIYYNISTSNCGSCPPTTTHPNVTCTNTPTNGSVDTCMLAVQTVVCGNIASNFSNPFRGSFCPTTTTTTAMPITASPLSILHPTGTTSSSNPATITHAVTTNTCTKGTNNSGGTQTLVTHSSYTDTACIISTTSLAVALIVTVVALVITTSIVLVKNDEKRKITYHLPQNNKKEERNLYMEEVHMEPVHKEHIEPLPTVSVVGTKKEERNIYVEAVYKENSEPLPTVSVIGTVD